MKTPMQELIEWLENYPTEVPTIHKSAVLAKANKILEKEKALHIPDVGKRIFRRGDKVEWRGMKLIVVEVGVGEVLIATSENVDDEDYNDWWVRNEYVC
tara:strand:- start:171 stop:467 length:297 start_codon:yes stop_codon:yes gene_type:complete